LPSFENRDTPLDKTKVRRFSLPWKVNIDEYPQLAILAWNRAVREMSAREAFALYEHNWRQVEVKTLRPERRRSSPV